ncbi:MAG TPA: HGxxPAAW family protein [Propionibacteriaceae bacterium]|jgi:ABC-type bacteriocin/lantibiotic exporter with double-glycine peptidase domain|nr:HGxxPAAW family protein [Propionibacteriaceae bacterium]
MASTGQQPAKVVHHDQPVKHVHHGRTLAAWTGTSIAMVAFIVGGIAVVIQNWPLFWACVALLVVAVIATKVLQVMGHGAR